MAKLDIKIGNLMTHDDLACSQSLASAMSDIVHDNLFREWKEYNNMDNNIIEWKLKCINVSRNNKRDFTIGKVYSLTMDGLKSDNYTWKNFLSKSGDNPYEKWLEFVDEAQNVWGDILNFELVGVNYLTTSKYIDNGIDIQKSVSNVHTIGENLFDSCNIPLRPVPVIDDREYPLHEKQYKGTPFEDTGILNDGMLTKNVTRGVCASHIFIDHVWDIELYNKEDSKMKDRVGKRYQELWDMWCELQNIVDGRLEEEKVLDSLGIYNDLDISKLKSEKGKINNLLKGYSSLSKMGITNIANNDPHTIVNFSNGDEVISKTSDYDNYDLEKGVLLALVKHSSSCTDYHSNRTYSFEIFDAIDDFVNRRWV
jgi:hypothetical protein